MTAPLRLEYAAKPVGVNAERKASHWARSAGAREWRHAFHLLALEAKAPSFDAVTITVEHYLADRRSSPDAVTGCTQSFKAAVDGLVDAGVLPGDGPDVVRSVTFRAPEVRGYHALVLTVREAGE